ncbi:PIN domain nuclease, partial [Xanthomonas sp. LMG 8992]|uniref:PIN domain nuclease n=1 Tax=Xanthomonas sp. LMG 8992 TaxID=1591157 RepID=UPI001F3FBA39
PCSRNPKTRAILPPPCTGTRITNCQLSVLLNNLPPRPNGIDAIDPNEACLLVMSLAGEADSLVTGDRRAGLLQRGSIGRPRRVTPATFCARAL